MKLDAYHRCNHFMTSFSSSIGKFIIAAILLGVVPHQAASAGANPTVSILSSSQAGITLKVAPGSQPQRTVNLNGRAYILFDGVVAADGDEGKPLLPSQGILLGIPPTARASLEIVSSSYETLPSQLVAPSPHYRFDEDMNAHQEYAVDEAAYSRNSWYPSTSAELAEVSQLRFQRVAKILIHPYQFNPARAELRKLTSLTLNIRFTYASEQRETETFQSVGADPLFEKTYKTLLANYDDSKKWRGTWSRRTPEGNSADSSRSWFDPAMPYLKLLIAQDGLYKLTYSDLSSAGINLGTINPQTFRLFNRGAQVPLFVAGESDGVMDPADYLEFYARRNYGKGEFFDIYTDTSAYWLTYGGTNGSRMVVEATDTTGTPALSFERTVHFEQDNLYYAGYVETEIIQPENVPGEGWYWSDFYPGTTTNFDFSLQNVVAGAGTNAVLRLRLNGMTLHSATPDHLAKVTLNGSALGQVGFDFTSDTVFTVSFSSALLKEGTNTLTVQSLPTAAPVNKFYLDWLEVSYQCAFKAIANQLSFNSQGPSGSSPIQYTITGFQSAAVDVYNLRDRKKFANMRIVPSPNAGVVVTFRDTASVSKQYIVLAEDQKLKPARMELKQFKDIRNNPAGADYIIITHRLFKESADRLASYRASQMGVRTAVIDIQDIYDEFNYGVFSPEAIKPFLQYTFNQWARPAPTYVLLFGDASWDFKFHMANSVKQNFVPAYGNPSTDNWFVAFDSTNRVLPSMLIGRLPAESPIEAEQVVDKLMQYDQTPIGEWVKNFLFITGGNDAGEKSSFNSQAEFLITNYILPAPIGGYPNRVYKKTDAIIDGENKQLIQDIISNGTIFLNFIGHSGGRIWGVDAGSPNDLRNTGGQFVFVTSVSCNVAAFATSFSNVLTEDWLFASGRAAIACWAGSSLGYPDIGFALTSSFLNSVTRDSVRDLGELTTTARINLWKSSPASSRVIAGVQLHPLLGDPIGILALPEKPDLTIGQTDVSFDPTIPTEIDSLVKVKAKIKNYGLVPSDSLGVKLTDTFGGLATPIGVGTYRLAPVFLRDSLLVIWNVARKPGNHIISLQIDPSNQINEVTKANNRVDVPIEVFASLVLPIKPAASSIVPRGEQTLEVTGPTSSASRSVKYFFEVDTSSGFNSSARMASPAIDAGILTTKWVTPGLTTDGLYYWRSRTFDGRDSGVWASSSFLVSGTSGTTNIRWAETDSKQFLHETRFQAHVTDSGVTIAKAGGVPIYVRSLGFRNNADKDYYSIIRVINQTVTGYWWVVGNGFIVASVNELDGTFEYRGYDVSSNAALADSMAQYLRNLSQDRFIVVTVVFDGYTNDTEALYSALESLGAKQIRSVRRGESWAFIGQKRTGIALESYSADAVAEINYLIPSFYNVQTGKIATSAIGAARRWRSVSWTNDASGAGTDISLGVVGLKSTGALDTLMVLPKNVLSADLSAIDTKTYPMLSLFASLRSTFGTATPILKSWSVEYEGLPDPAIAAELVRLSRDSVLEGGTVECTADIQNIGYTTADSVKVNFYLLDQGNVRRLFQSSRVYNLEAEKSKSVSATLNSTGLRGVQSLVVELDSKPLVELYDMNDVATRTFYVRRDTIGVVASLVLPIKPAASSIVPRGEQTLEVTIATGTASRSLKYFFEADTSSGFNSSAKIASPAIDAGILTTHWVTSALTTDDLYYWRSRIFDGRDSGAWATSSFVVSGVPPAAGVVRWTEAHPGQFIRDQRFQADVTDSGVIIAKAGGVPIHVRSLGYRNNADSDYYSVIKIVDQTVFGLWWVIGNGFIVASVNELDGTFEYRGYDVSSNATLADSMAQYLRDLSQDRFIVVTVVFDGYTNDTEALYSALESLGAKQIRSVRRGESWAFIGQKRTGIALEGYSADAVAEINYLIPSFYNLQTGKVATDTIGVARRWRSVSWTNDASGAGTDISLGVVGLKSNGALDTLMVLPKKVLSADLSGIDAKTYPMLSLFASLQSTFGTATPILKSWTVEYEGLPDPAIAAELVRLSQDSVLEGGTIECTADIQNIGYTTADSVTVNFYLLDQSSVRRLFQSSRVYNLEPEKSKTVSVTLNSAGLRGVQSLVVELDSKPLVELYEMNDIATRTFYLQHDTIAPQLQVTFDGVSILSGDYVSAKPNILIKLFDNSPLPIQDTSSVSLRLDNLRVPYVNNAQLTYSFPSTGNEKAELQFQPQLTDGSHSLFVDAQDATGNPINNSPFRVDFSARNAPTLQDVYNYPNPFSTETFFTFNLTGSVLPDELKIRIYTVAGRLIQTLFVPVNSLRFGFNRVYWDGRDNDGNEVANGVYLYTMVLKSGDKSDNVTQRLAKVR